MDVNSATDGSGRKLSLEELSKEELIKKCKNLLVLAQKGKQLKDSLQEENANLLKQLESRDASQEIIETLTEQKLNLVTNISELKNQKNVLNEKLLIAENKLVELDTENQGYKRQVTRLTDENEELISHLEQLEKEIEELKSLGLKQQEQLLELEKNESNCESHQEIKEDYEMQISALKVEIDKLRGSGDNENLRSQIDELKCKEILLKQKVSDQKVEIEKHINATDDLNVELHKNKALVENLKKDLTKINSKLSESQIMSSGVASDLQNANDKLREKLQFFHSKIVKLANTAKVLKNEKDILLIDLKHYMKEGKIWKEQLNVFMQKLTEDYRDFSITIENLKKENVSLQNEIKSKENNPRNQEDIEKLNDLLRNVENSTEIIRELKIENEELKQKLQTFEEENKEMEGLRNALEQEKHEKNSLNLEIQNNHERIKELEETTIALKALEEDLKKLRDAANDEVKALKIALNQEKVENKNLVAQIEDSKQEMKKLFETKATLEEKLGELMAQSEGALQNEKIVSELKECIAEKSSRIEELDELNQELRNALEQEKHEKNSLNLEIQNNHKKIKELEETTISLKVLEEDLKKLRDATNDEVKALKIALNQEKVENKNLVAQIEDSKQEIKKLFETKATLEEKLGELMAQSEDALRNEKIVSELKECIAEKSSRIEELDELNQELRNALEHEKQEKNSLNLEIQNNHKKIKELEDTSKALQGLHEDLQKLRDAANDEVKALNIALSQEKTENEKLIAQIEDRKQGMKLFETKATLDALQNEKIISELTESVSEKSSKISELNSSLEEANKKITSYLHQFLNIQTIIGVTTTDSDIPSLTQRINQLIESEKTLSNLESELKSLRDAETRLAAHASEEIERLVQQNNELLEINRSFRDRLTATVETQTEELDVSEDELGLLRREKLELLAQMNEMNQELKERSENISQQQVHCKELQKKLQAYETQAGKKDEVIKSLTDQLEGLGRNDLEEKELEVQRLQAEVERLREERLNKSVVEGQNESFADNEANSTSTMSRTEEVNRMKDLEGPWEERYGKLRSLATKMKGKIRDLTAELGKEQSEKSEFQAKLASSLKTIQTLQVKCDKLEDELESSRNEVKTYLRKLDSVAMDISKDKQNLALNDETITSLKQEIEMLKKDKLDVENWKKQVGAKVKSLKQEIEANNMLKKEYESKILKLQQELEAKDLALKNESEQHKQTKNSLQESANECKKKSVLNLEMQDYERSVKELSQKLEDKQDTIIQLKNQVDAGKSTVNALREQNKLLEERLESEEAELAANRGEIILHKRKIGELEDLLVQKEDKLHSLTRSIEETRLENEELSRELSKVIAEHQKNTSGLKVEVDKLRRQVLGLEQSLREARDALKLKEDELRVIEQEYKSYKVRAQSVLRQNQTRDVGIEEKLAEEVASLKAQVGSLGQETLKLKEKIGSVGKENESLITSNEELKRKCIEAEMKLEDTQTKLEQIKSKHQQTLNEHAEIVRGLKLHADTLSQCYRQQLSDQEVRHNREIIELQSKLNKPPSPTEPPSLPYPTMTREEGEGSESVESQPPSNGSRPVPLEKLLTDEETGEAAQLKRQLIENEAKVTHLTDLLADTEQDLAKHVQMNQVLKEEIRRQQRSVEREKHAENLEYLKNVVLKFVTLNNSDERLRLVPVMNTILKLSPEETSQLNTVAKGESGGKGWSNYLPLSWPSSGNRTN